jgi:histone H3
VALREVWRYQKSTEMLMRKSPFRRWVRELLEDIESDVSVRGDTFLCLQETVEDYLVNLFEDTQVACIHRKTITIKVKDIGLVKLIRKEKWC